MFIGEYGKLQESYRGVREVGGPSDGCFLPLKPTDVEAVPDSLVN